MDGDSSYNKKCMLPFLEENAKADNSNSYADKLTV